MSTLTALLLLALLLGALKGMERPRRRGLGSISRRRAEAAALRQEMDLHPVERA